MYFSSIYLIFVLNRTHISPTLTYLLTFAYLENSKFWNYALLNLSNTISGVKLFFNVRLIYGNLLEFSEMIKHSHVWFQLKCVQN